MKKNYLLLVFALFTCSLFAQDGVFEGRDLDYRHSSLTDNFKEFETVQFNSQEIYDYALKNENPNVPLFLELKMPSGEFFPIYLHRNKNLRLDKTIVRMGGEKGVTDSELNDPIIPMNGFIRGVEGSRVALTVGDGIIYGYIDNGVDVLFIEPASYLVKNGQKDIFVVYNAKDVIDKGHKCGANVLEEEKQEQKSQLRMNDPCLVQYNVEIALAADFSMFDKYLNNGGVTAYLTGVMNNVQTNYDDEFDQAVIFTIVVFWISPCDTCDPWSNTLSAFTMIFDFRDWGQAGGFGLVTYDIAGFWTDRDFTGGTVGIAFVNATCGTNRYHVCQDFSNNAQQIRVLTAHEIGHNFGLGHVSDGCIMNPFVTTSNCWAPASITTMNNNLPNFACLEEVFCELDDLPALPPPPINVLCGSGTRCTTLDIECGDQLFYSENDQELEVSTDGMTICLQSTDCDQRITPIDIFVMDPCGQISPVVTWNINIDPSPICCFFTIPTPTRFYCVRERGGVRIYWTGVTGAAYYDWQLIGGGKCCRTSAPASYRGSVRGTSVFLSDSWLNRGCYTFSARTADGFGRFSAYTSYCYDRCLYDIPVEEREQTVEQLNEKASLLEIAPNPNNGHFSMILDADVAGERSLRILDLKGQEIWTAKENVQKGENIIDIDLPNALPGMYIMSVNDGEKMKMKKFIVNSSLR